MSPASGAGSATCCRSGRSRPATLRLSLVRSSRHAAGREPRVARRQHDPRLRRQHAAVRARTAAALGLARPVGRGRPRSRWPGRRARRRGWARDRAAARRARQRVRSALPHVDRDLATGPGSACALGGSHRGSAAGAGAHPRRAGGRSASPRAPAKGAPSIAGDFTGWKPVPMRARRHALDLHGDARAGRLPLRLRRRGRHLVRPRVGARPADGWHGRARGRAGGLVTVADARTAKDASRCWSGGTRTRSTATAAASALDHDTALDLVQETFVKAHRAPRPVPRGGQVPVLAVPDLPEHDARLGQERPPHRGLRSSTSRSPRTRRTSPSATRCARPSATALAALPPILREAFLLRHELGHSVRGDRGDRGHLAQRRQDAGGAGARGAARGARPRLRRCDRCRHPVVLRRSPTPPTARSSNHATQDAVPRGRARPRAAHAARAGLDDRGAAADARVHAALETALKAGIPVSLLERKIAEGKAKGVPMDRIAAAVENRLDALTKASEAMAKGGLEHPTEGDLSVAADAVQGGVSATALATISQTAPQDRRAVAIAVLTDLVALGHTPESALEQVQAALARGPEALANLPGAAAARTGERRRGCGGAGRGRPGRRGRRDAGGGRAAAREVAGRQDRMRNGPGRACPGPFALEGLERHDAVMAPGPAGCCRGPPRTSTPPCPASATPSCTWSRRSRTARNRRWPRRP